MLSCFYHIHYSFPLRAFRKMLFGLFFVLLSVYALHLRLQRRVLVYFLFFVYIHMSTSVCWTLGKYCVIYTHFSLDHHQYLPWKVLHIHEGWSSRYFLTSNPRFTLQTSSCQGRWTSQQERSPIHMKTSLCATIARILFKKVNVTTMYSTIVNNPFWLSVILPFL